MSDVPTATPVTDQASCGSITHQSDRQLGLFDMPVEIITEIVSYLPPESLLDCYDAHPMFVQVVQGKRFKNKYIKAQLGLADDDDVKYSILPDRFSPLVELWYLTNFSMAKHRARRSGRFRPMLSRSNRFFSLACFKHLYQTWLVQAGCLKLSKPHKINSDGTEKPTTKKCECDGTSCSVHQLPRAKVCHELFEGHLPNLPKYVIDFLTKLFLVVPDFLERSLFMRHLNLRKGIPMHLAHGIEFLRELKAMNFPTDFKPHFSLEIISGERRMDDCGDADAMFLLFAPDKCILWIGTVSEFPQCVHETTSALKVIDTKIPLYALKEELSQLDRAFQQAFTADHVGHKFHKQQLFPGACYEIHLKKRKELCNEIVPWVNGLARRIHSDLSTIKLSQGEELSEASLPRPLWLVLTYFGVDLSVYSRECNPCKDRWGIKYLVDHQYFPESQLTCQTCLHFAENIRRTLLLISNIESKYFLGHSKTHCITCERCRKRYASTVGPDTTHPSDETPWSTFQTVPVHSIVMGLSMMHSAFTMLYVTAEQEKYRGALPSR